MARRSALRSFLRATGIFLSGTMVFIVALALLGILWLRTDAGNRWLLTQLLPLVQPARGILELEGLHTDLFSNARLEGLQIRDPNGNLLLGITSAEAHYRLGSLPALLVVTDLQIEGVSGDLRWDPKTGLDLANIWDTAPSDPNAEPFSLPLDLEFDKIGLGISHFSFQTEEQKLSVEDVALQTQLSASKRSGSVSDLHLQVGKTEPDFGAIQLDADATLADGRAIRFDRLEGQLGAQRFTLIGTIGDLLGIGHLDLALVEAHLEPDQLPVPAIEPYHLKGPLEMSGAITGSFSAPKATLLLQGPMGSLSTDLHLDLPDTSTAPLAQPSWGASFTTTDLRPADLSDRLPVLQIAGTGSVNGSGFDAENLGADATFSGNIDGIPSMDRVQVTTQAGYHAQVLTIARADVDGRGLSTSLTGSWNLKREDGAVAVHRMQLDLSQLRRVPTMLTIIPELPSDIREAVAPMSSLNLDGTVGWEGTVGRNAAGVLTAEGVLDLQNFSYPPDVKVRRLWGPIAAQMGEGLAAPSPAGPELLSQLLCKATLQFSDLEAKNKKLSSGKLELSLDEQTAHADIVGNDEGGERLALVGTFGRSSGHFSLDSLRGRVPSATSDQHLSGQGSGTLKGRDAETLQIENLDLHLSAGDASVSATGNLAMHGPIALSLKVVNVQPQMASAFAPTADWAGLLNLSADIKGSLQAPEIDAVVDVADLAIPERVLDLDLHATANGAGKRVKVEGTIAENLLLFSGTLPLSLDPEEPGLLTNAPLQLSVHMPSTRSRRLQDVLVADIPPVTASASLEVGGTVEVPTARLITTSLASPGSQRERIQTDLDVTLGDQSVSVEGVVWERSLPRGLISGIIPFDTKQLMSRILKGDPPGINDVIGLLGKPDLTLTARKLPLSYLVEASGQRLDVKGVLVGTMHMGGALRQPMLNGSFFLDNAQVGRVAIRTGLLKVVTAPGGFQVDLQTGFEQSKMASTDFVAAGFVPFQVDFGVIPTPTELLSAEGLALHLAGSGIPLDLLGTPIKGFSNGKGNLRITGDITGSILEPVPDLQVQVADGGFSLESTGVRYENLTVDASIIRKILTVSRMEMDSLAEATEEAPTIRDISHLEATFGATRGESWFPDDLIGDLTLTGFRVSALPDRAFRVTGKSHLGMKNGLVSVTGNMDVDRALLKLRQDFFAEGNSMALHPDIHVIGVADAESSTSEGIQGMLDMIPEWLKINMSVDLGENLYGTVALPLEDRFGKLGRDFSTVKVEGEVSGKIKLEASHSTLSLTGTLTPQRGQARVLGKTFTVQEGSISFTGRDFLSPEVKVKASFATSNFGDMEVNISGTPTKPKVSFSSDKYSEADVLAIILTGHPSSENAGSGSLLTETAASAVLGLLQDQLGEGTGTGVVESVQLDTRGVQGGFRVSKRVTIYTRYNFANKTSGTVPLEVTLEWSLPRNWSLEVTGGGNGQSISALRTWRF